MGNTIPGYIAQENDKGVMVHKSYFGLVLKIIPLDRLDISDFEIVKNAKSLLFNLLNEYDCSFNDDFKVYQVQLDMAAGTYGNLLDKSNGVFVNLYGKFNPFLLTHEMVHACSDNQGNLFGYGGKKEGIGSALNEGCTELFAQRVYGLFQDDYTDYCLGKMRQYIVDYKDRGSILRRIYSKMRRGFITPYDHYCANLFINMHKYTMTKRYYSKETEMVKVLIGVLQKKGLPEKQFWQRFFTADESVLDCLGEPLKQSLLDLDNASLYLSLTADNQVKRLQIQEQIQAVQAILQTMA